MKKNNPKCLAIYPSTEESNKTLLYHICHDCLNENDFELISLSLEQDNNFSHSNQIIKVIASNESKLKLIIADISVPFQKNDDNNGKQEELVSYFGNLYYIIGCAYAKKIQIILVKNIKNSAVGVLPGLIRKHTIIGYNSCYAIGINKLISRWLLNNKLEELCINRDISNNTQEYKGKYTLNGITYKVKLEICDFDRQVIVSTLCYKQNNVSYSVLQSHNKMDACQEDDIPDMGKGPQLSYRGVAYYNTSEMISEGFLLTGIVIHFNNNSDSAHAQVWVKISKDIPNNKSNIFTLKKTTSNNPSKQQSEKENTHTNPSDVNYL